MHLIDEKSHIAIDHFDRINIAFFVIFFADFLIYVLQAFIFRMVTQNKNEVC